ncbi:tail fiber assembly protein [Citrobacter sedlakii]|uniref:tail fiber assembly protein n=1 Tax=Citrobacter sedlakii TaxID=67826 RepID=UPI00287BD5B9|nr:tail fiber assembly protein [Citrobacter sedlakii]
MKYFIDDADIIYAYEDDGSQDELIGNKKEITEDEVNLILNHPPSQEELIEQAEAKKLQLRDIADAEIIWRQDAVDVGIATTEETAALSDWKKYRVLLMRVDTSTAPDIEWPVKPE